nr:aminopeptidase P family protein [Plastoroseomonas arctica]
MVTPREDATHVTADQRLAALRTRLAAVGIDGMLVPRADEHLGEYVPASAERLAWLTGFTGSAGMAIVLRERAAIFTDGRYTLQVTQQTDPALWERRHLTEEPPAEWLRANAAGLRIGFDPWLYAEPALARFEAAGITLVPLETNPIDTAWADRPAPPGAPLIAHPTRFAGREAAEKRAELAATLSAAGQDAVVLADPASSAWLLNIRGQDVPFTPLALAFAIAKSSGAVDLFIDPDRADAETRAHLGNAVRLRPRGEFLAALDALGGQRVRIDPDATPAAIARHLRAAGAVLHLAEDPCRMPRACKNATEQAGARNAHHRDGAAMVRFLAWFTATAPGGALTEISAAEALLAERAKDPMFRGESFPAIAGSGPHGAIVHYRVSPESNRAIAPDEVFLLDSGGQYADGTTDITRTLWTGPGPAPALLRARATRVLRGHIALASLCFPEGVAGPHLDAIARRPLWDAGEDFDHGTGHGVGSYLSVHEGPVAFSRAARPVPLREGMILSDEPGFYAVGEYGIRLENLILVRRAERPGANRPFLDFETLTLAPFDRALIEPALLTPAERCWLDGYHARVLAEIGPLLDAPTLAWLDTACAPL